MCKIPTSALSESGVEQSSWVSSQPKFEHPIYMNCKYPETFKKNPPLGGSF